MNFCSCNCAVMCLCSFSWMSVLYTIKLTRHMPSKKVIRGTSVCFFNLVHLVLSMGIFIIKHYSTEVEKQNRFYEKNELCIIHMKSNLREIIHYIDESTLENAKNEKVQKQESPSKVSKDVEESVDKMISNRMSKAYSEWKSNQDTRPYNENIEKEYQKLLETLSPEQEEVLTKYCDEIFASGAETEEFFYRLGIKDGLRLKSTVKSVLEMIS